MIPALRLDRKNRAVRFSDHLKARLDWPVALRPGRLSAPPFRVYVIAREQNAAHVSALARQTGGRIEVWPLDERPGRKFDLLDRMLRERPPEPEEWLVVADDDIRLVRGDVGRFVAIAAAAGFDLAQPGQDRRGFATYGVTVSKPLTRARLTSFVTAGPLFAVSPGWRERIVATFPGSGMGWALPRIWRSLAPRPRLGVIDEVRMRHLVKTGTGYDVAEARREMYATWERFGLWDGQQAQYTYRTWHAWQRIPHRARLTD